MDYVTLTADQCSTLTADQWASLPLDTIPTTVTVTPPSVSLGDLATQQFVATVLDQLGQPIANPSVTWAVETAGPAVNGTGLYTQGGRVVRATSGSASGTALVTDATPQRTVDALNADQTANGLRQQFNAILNGTTILHAVGVDPDTLEPVPLALAVTILNGLADGSLVIRANDSQGQALATAAGQQGGGTGDIAVTHNYRGTDELRVLDSNSQPADNVLIQAYVKADYDAGTIDPKPPSSVTGSDGRWIRPLKLDADTYTVTYYNPDTKIDYATTLVVV